MRRLVVLAAAGTLVAAAVSADAAIPAFGYGVAAGEITATSAILWTRAPSSGAVRVRVAQRRSLADGRLRTARATSSHDLTVSIAVRGSVPVRATTTTSLAGPCARRRASPAPRSS